MAPYDLVTGVAVEAIDTDEFRIDGQHHLDLSEAVRQYEQTAIRFSRSAVPPAPGCVRSAVQSRPRPLRVREGRHGGALG